MKNAYVRQSLDIFIANNNGKFPSRRELRSTGISEGKMYKTFGGMSQLKKWYMSKDMITKESLIAKLRVTTCIVEHVKFGVPQRNALTLEPAALGNYQGNGTSKKTNSDLIFAYDVDEKRFRAVTVSTIKSVVAL